MAMVVNVMMVIKEGMVIIKTRSSKECHRIMVVGLSGNICLTW